MANFLIGSRGTLMRLRSVRSFAGAIRATAFLAVLLGAVGVVRGEGSTGADGGSSPEAMAVRFVEARIKGPVEAQYDLVSCKDRQARSRDELTRLTSLTDRLLMQWLSVSSRAAAIESRIDGDSAMVTVETWVPDLRGALGDLMALSMATNAGASDARQSELVAALASKVRSLVSTESAGPMMALTEAAQLVRENDRWVVTAGWAREAAREQDAALTKERGRRVEELQGSAKRAVRAERYSEAEASLKEALSLAPDDQEVAEALRAVSEKATAEATRRAYMGKVQVYDLKADMFDAAYDGKKPGLTFKLKNTGDRTLTKVQVTVYFQDSSGTTISEDVFHPVNVGGMSFGSSRSRPLRPNYIWQVERGKFYTADQVPSEWAVGKATARVTKIEFEDED